MRRKAPARILIGFRLVEALRDVLSGIGSYIKQHQRHWQVRCVDADEFAQLLNPHSADAAITVISASSRDLIDRARRCGVPVVNMLHDAHPALPSVLSDDPLIGAAAARHLIGLGFKDFAFLGVCTQWSKARQQGFEHVLAESGKFCRVWQESSTTHYGALVESRSASSLRRWILSLPKPSAVLACSDLVGTTLLTLCEAAGVRVPEDVAIIGVDNIVQTCELAPVPLSSVPQDFPRLGFEAARLVDRLLAGKSPPAKSVCVAPGPVQVRRSTDVLTFDDPYVAAAIRMIHEHVEDGISMKQLLREVGVSRKWLDVQFKSLIGHTPSHEIRRLRLNRIRDLLLATDMSVKQIAMRCGFSCSENLTRFFRDGMGLAPQAYRAQWSGQKTLSLKNLPAGI